MKGLVSVAMCTYNGERFIKEQLDSILNQSYKNLEIIITDDGSTDTTIDIIKEYQQTDKRIYLYQNETNLGFSKNFEKAISLCTGEYIALSDQDDIWKKNKIEKFLLEIKDNVLIYSDAILIDENSKELNQNLLYPKNRLISGRCNKALLFRNYISGNTLMFKSELTQYITPIPQKIKFHDYWIAFIASSYGSVTYTTDAMTYYRRYSEQITNHEQIKYKNILEKIKHKKDVKLLANTNSLDYLKVLRDFQNLTNRPTNNIIDSLIQHFENYENCYFNFKLYKLLKKHESEIFAGYRISKIKRRAFRFSTGLKLKLITLYRI